MVELMAIKHTMYSWRNCTNELGNTILKYRNLAQQRGKGGFCNRKLWKLVVGPQFLGLHLHLKCEN